MRASATLLAAARGVDGLWGVVRATGLAGAPVALDGGARSALGVEDVGRAEMAAGAGSVRVLALEATRPRESLRDTLQRLARRLSAHAPHVLWLVAAVDARGEQAALIGWTAGDRAPHVASFVWEPDHVVDSDAETLCALAAVRGDVDVLVHARCLEVLGREALTRRFYRVLDAQVGALAASLPRRPGSADARELAILCVSRLLFLRFLEAKGWLNGEREFIAARFDACMADGGAFHRRVLLPLFFGTLNTPVSSRAARARTFGRIPFLNGGLFARAPLERRVGDVAFPDDRLGALIQGLFQQFRFVAREDSASWSEASVDPEMLGRAFESLMTSGDRRAGGVFFTPHALVERVGEHALARAARERDPAALRSLRVLDPACGSGAFLVFALEQLAEWRRRLGDAMDIASVRRDVLARSIFGVDRSPTAVWLCELRLWLAVVIECDDADPMRVPPLPNLDRNIRVGDALAGPGFASGLLAAGGARAAGLHERYVRATGRRKQSLGRMLDRLERRRAVEQADRLIAATQHARRELIVARRSRDLFGERRVGSPETDRDLRRLRDTLRQQRGERRRLADGGALPFSYTAHFAEAQAAGGFDVVLGNPPWVRLHRIPPLLRERLRDSFEVFRLARWQAGAASARAAPGFASQVDLSALFVERARSLLRPGGTLSLLLPAKLWRSLSGGGVRHLLATRARLTHLEDASDARHAFDAVVYPSLLAARAESPGAQSLTVVVHGRRGVRSWPATVGRMAFDSTPGAPWVLLSPDARQAFERIRRAGAPLAEVFGAPRLGVKSGCNAAFLVQRVSCARGLSTVADASGEIGTIECALLRPALRGDAVRAWRAVQTERWIVWTHGPDGAPLPALPARAAAWLQRHYGALATRADATGARRWWSLFRVDAASADATRVVWADFGRRPRALVLDAGDRTVPLNTCYVIHCPDACDAWALAGLLNSRLAASWLNALAEPARGGYRRYLGWTVGQLPVPREWPRARLVLSRAAHEATADNGAAGGDALEFAVLEAFGLEARDIAPLLEPWPCA